MSSLYQSVGELEATKMKFKCVRETKMLQKHLSKPHEVDAELKPSTFIKNVQCYSTEYCQNTSIHGLKFLGEKGRTIFERLWWMAIIAISLYFCSGLILKTYQKWEKSPVIVTFATDQTPTWQIPFPAVTICPETKTKPQSYNFTKMHWKRLHGRLLENETEQYEYMNLICVHKKQGKYEFLDEKALHFIANVAPSFNDSFLACRWMETKQNASNVLVPIMADAGVCYTFNILDRTEMFTNDVYRYEDYQSTSKSQSWSLERAFSETLNYSYPRRAFSSGAKAGLTLILYSSKANKDYCCTAGLQGFKVHVHHPADIPRVEENYFRLSLDEVVNAAVKPNMMTTNEKLYNYKPQQRQCYFPGEKHLRFFKVYSQQNCQVECLTNFTLKSCACVAFHMPRTSTTPICGSAKMGCLNLAEERVLANDESPEIDSMPPNQICNCLPSCFSTNYDVEISQTKVDWEKCEANAQPDGHYFKLIIYFKERQFLTSERNELYGQTDFLANCGGLLSLFIGFSFISVMELFYFLTLRLFCNLRKYGRHFWSGDKQMLDENLEFVEA